MSIEIITPGPGSSLQDIGRLGYLQYGIGQGGVMDKQAYMDALYLTGNTSGEAVLEMTFMGATISFLEDTVFALTGADMCAKLNGEPVNTYETLVAHKGDRLEMGLAVNGLRGYFSVAGGFTVEKVLGSRSTNVKCKMGGFAGRNIQSGDVLPCPRSVLKKPRKLPKPVFEKNITLRAIPGPQDDYFTKKGLATFFSETYTMSGESDRMGLRFEGAPIESKNGTDIISDGIVFGSVQIPANGLPIILMADRQTTGGYAKIATIYSEDLPKLAQLAPGGTVSFQKYKLK